MACPATLQLLAGTGWRGRGSINRPSQKGLSCGRGSVIRASTLDLDGGLLKVPKRDLIRGLTAQRK